MKRCTWCGETKPIAQFYVTGGKMLQGCRPCRHEYYHQHKEHKAAYDRAYMKTEKGKEVRQGRMARWESANPIKNKAITAVSNALRDGRLHKTPCVKCGSVKNIQGHHEDYSKPLDVIWLCRGCHRAHHREAA